MKDDDDTVRYHFFLFCCLAFLAIAGAEQSWGHACMYVMARIAKN